MTLTYSPTDIAYDEARYQFIAKKELDPILAKNFYPLNVGDNKVTMGAGLNLTDGKDTNRYAVYSVLGINVDINRRRASTATGTLAQQTAEKGYIDRLNVILTDTTLTIDQKRIKLDEVMTARAADSTLDGYADNRKAYFVFESEAQIRQSFDLAVQFYEQGLQEKLNKYAPNVFADPAFANSKEHVALLSLFWNGEVLISRDLMKALSTSNRAEAWFEIRYKANTVGYKFSQNGIGALSAKDLKNYNNNFDRGWATRRYDEANLFGLYDDPTNPVALDEAKDIYRMFTQHRDQISAYEKTYGIAFDGALGTRGNNLGNIAYDIHNTLAPASTQLLADLAAGIASNPNADVAAAYSRWANTGDNLSTFNPTDLYLDPNTGAPQCHLLDASKDYQGNTNTSNSILIGGADDTNILTGGDGNDLLIGGNGNDELSGGKGDDYMAGGKGDDIYILDGGGHDTIEDKQGRNRIILNGKILTDFYTLGGTWFSKDGWFTGYMSNGDFIVTDKASGDQVTLNADFQEGDFGIHFKDAPVDLNISLRPATSREIIGDAKLKEFTKELAIDVAIDPAWKWNVVKKEVGQTEPVYDANGNYIGDNILTYNYTYNQQDDLDNWILDYGKTDATRNDGLRDSAGNDYIDGGGGDDYIDAYRGGDDFIDAGDGDNNVYAGDGNDFVQSGNGADSIYGGDGNDIILSGEGNDTVNAASGDDYVDGGMGQDILIGAEGKDTLVGNADGDILDGGMGDDRLFGDMKMDTVDAINLGNTAESINVRGDWLAGGWGDDTLVGSSANDVLSGGGGNDLLIAGAGNDYIIGDLDVIASKLDWVIGEGDVVSWGWSYADGMPGADDFGADVIYAGAGNDKVWGGAGADVIYGEEGDDQLVGDNGDGTGIEGNDYIDGGNGNDKILGGGGDDILLGGSGNDYIWTGTGNDLIEGGNESDQMLVGKANDFINCGDGNETLWWQAANDALFSTRRMG